MDKKERSLIFQKIKLIPGDITLPFLGIGADHQQLIFEDVTVVFHSAATVRFMEPLKPSVEMNIVATIRILELSKRMRNLKVGDFLRMINN